MAGPRPGLVRRADRRTRRPVGGREWGTEWSVAVGLLSVTAAVASGGWGCGPRAWCPAGRAPGLTEGSELVPYVFLSHAPSHTRAGTHVSSTDEYVGDTFWQSHTAAAHHAPHTHNHTTRTHTPSHTPALFTRLLLLLPTRSPLVLSTEHEQIGGQGVAGDGGEAAPTHLSRLFRVPSFLPTVVFPKDHPPNPPSRTQRGCFLAQSLGSRQKSPNALVPQITFPPRTRWLPGAPVVLQVGGRPACAT